ncbi:MAG: RNA polymerase sigma factor [Oscillospiraceae bacterium]|nr:RNA polymerase sigma factor [Oscillospiraceae bacterium]
MKPVNDLFTKIADGYSLMILNWAIKKTGSRADGEDLAQEVLCQILSFVKDRREEPIEKLDNLIWKIAHYTWCNRVRRSKKESNFISLDNPNANGSYINIIEERDYINEFAENEALKEELANLRRKISDLSKTQREIIIAYYLESLSVSDIAIKFNINKSAVKWHLFDARKKIKERFYINMDNNLNIVKPGKLFLGTNGDKGLELDIHRVNDNLIRQNICLLCYGDNGKTIGELTEMTGIPKPYLEFDLDWLVDREFLLLENKKHITNFGIKDRRHFQNIRDIYINFKEKYYRKIIDYLNSHEKDIRNIGFHGNDFAWNKLLWSLLTLYLRYFSESEPLKTIKIYNYANLDNVDLELHKDGGRYFINGFDQSEGQLVNLQNVITEGIFEPEKWNVVNGIWCRSCSATTSEFYTDDKSENCLYAAYWLGIYIFVHSVSTLTKNHKEQKIWRDILAHLLSNNFSISGMTNEENEFIAVGVKEKIIAKDGDKYIPQFTIFTFEQFKRLYSEIFEPLVQLIKPQTLELVEMFKELNERSLPRKIHAYVQRWTYFDIWDSGIKNFMFAADDGYLYMPETPEDGTALTLSFVY